MSQPKININDLPNTKNLSSGERLEAYQYAAYTAGVQTPLPNASPANIAFGFQAVNSTDLPGPNYVGMSITGPNGSQSCQIAVKWDTNGAQPNDMYVRVADPSAGNVWSSWAKVHTGNITFTTDTNEPTGGSPGDVVYVYEV